MHLLAFWRFDNYRRDLDAGAGFHFNSRDSRLHSVLNSGDSLWILTRIDDRVHRNGYRLAAKLVIRAKIINAPGYKYGPYRVWGDLDASVYFKIRETPADDVFELLRGLPLESGSFADYDRLTIGHAYQSKRALTEEANHLLAEFANHLEAEPRARLVPDERQLEAAVLHGDNELGKILDERSSGISRERREELRAARPRNRQLVADLYQLYAGRCQLCAFDSETIYNTATSEAHHIHYLSRGGEDAMENLALVCPNHHTVIHTTDARFDYAKLAFFFPNGRVEPLCLNTHLSSRALN